MIEEGQQLGGRLDSEFADDGRAYTMPFVIEKVFPWYLSIDLGSENEQHTPLARVTIHLASDGTITVECSRSNTVRFRDDDVELHTVSDVKLLPFTNEATQ